MASVIYGNATEASHADATALIEYDVTLDESQATTNLHDDVDPFSDGTGDSPGFFVGYKSGSDEYRGLLRITLPSTPNGAKGDPNKIAL